MDCVKGCDRPCWGKGREVNQLAQKSQGKSTAWPDLGYQSPPPHALTTTGLCSQQRESMERASVSWDSVLPSQVHPVFVKAISHPSSYPSCAANASLAPLDDALHCWAAAVLALRCSRGAGAGPQTTLWQVLWQPHQSEHRAVFMFCFLGQVF